jgi:fumagillin biosynthesis cytochrome P450 monooxygenase
MFSRKMSPLTYAVFSLAGAHTTVSLLITFTLAMVLFPEVQKKVQEELDRVVGQGRLPDFRDLLAYLVATIRETMRWNPMTPM